MKTKLARPLPGQRVHFVAIGGVGMAAIAELLLVHGYEVSGSDLKRSGTVRRLEELGATINVGAHRAEHAEAADHVVYSNAVGRDNAEVAYARHVGIEVMARGELLGRIFAAGRGIAVAGTHGKTTTSSMLAVVLDGTGFEPSFLIGGDVNEVGSGAALGASDLVVAEADEAYGSFLELHPELALVTNIDRDHPEYYADQDAIDSAFITFLGQRREGGWAVLPADDQGVRRIRADVAEPVATYSAGPDGSGGVDLVLGPDSDVIWRGARLGPMRLGVPGRHNRLNAASALTAALLLGADPGLALEALRTFRGVDRRFSVRGDEADVTVVDDYAHNPRKVSSAISAAGEAFPGRRVVVLFQPHRYQRTLHLAGDFGTAFDDADLVVVTDVYGGPEEPIPGVSGRLVCDAVRAQSSGPQVIYAPRLEDAAGLVAGLTEPGDVVLTLGAGDVTTAAPLILEMLRTKDD